MRTLTPLAAGFGALLLAACSDLVEPPVTDGGPAVQAPSAAHISPPFDVSKLLAGDGAADDNFGWTVAVSGDVAVVGALGDDHAGPFSGSAYVFERAGGVWTQVAKLTAPDAAPSHNFSFSVAVDGDVAVISARLDDAGGSNAGSAYVFERAAGVWAQVAKLTASDAAAFDQFGFSVAVSGDVAVVGALGDDHAGSNSGSAYVFERAAGAWTQVAKLAASDATADDQFGSSVAVSGDVAVIGTQRANGNSGNAYVFEFDGGQWNQAARLAAGDGAANDFFGLSVAVSGDLAVVGAAHDDDAGTSSGSAYVFERAAGAWTQVAKLTAFDAAADDRFGWSVAANGDAAVVGARGDGSFSGSAYAFSLFDRNQPPIADAGPDQTVECTDADDGTTTVTLDGTGSSDPDGTNESYEWSIGGDVIATGANPDVELSHGTYTVTLTVTDDGGATDTDEVEIDIVDTTPPSIDFTLDETELWSPDHRMVTVATGIGATDLCDPSPTVSVAVTSDEPVNGPGDGNTSPDWEITDNGDGTFDVAVRAERAGDGDGRVYTIEVTATDAAGNVVTATGEVTVPHNQGRGGPPGGRGRGPR